MYVHAYQSYVWNAVVSERVRTNGSTKPVVGDLVFEQMAGRVKIDDASVDDVDMVDVDNGEVPWLSCRKHPLMPTIEALEADDNQPAKRQKRVWVQPKVKTLTEDDVDKHTIFDVIMPLPGKDVAYPGGVLGERYREFVRMDGLDPDNFSSKHKWVPSWMVDLPTVLTSLSQGLQSQWLI